jgi:hypothetical protein
MISHKDLDLVGWREWVFLPEFTKTKIKAKIDTGARTCALHAEEITIVKKAGKKYVRFKIYPVQKSREKAKWVEAEMLEKRLIKSSVGTETIRPVIKTLLQIGPHVYSIELTLVNRDIMGFRMLIGRQALNDRFVVDPGDSFIQSKALNKKKVGRSS